VYTVCGWWKPSVDYVREGRGCEVRGSDSSGADDASPLGCDDESVDAYFLTFHGIVVPLKCGATHPGTCRHIPEYLNPHC